MVSIMNPWKVVDVPRDVFGPYVNDVWAFRTPDGKLVKHVSCWRRATERSFERSRAEQSF